MKLMVLEGSARPTSRGKQVSKWVEKVASSDPRFEVSVVDSAELNLPFYSEEVSPFGMKRNNLDYSNPIGKAWAQNVGETDGFIFLVAEYNHGYTAVLKNAIDWVGPQWVDKPVGFVSYATTIIGGARAVEQLRQVVVEVSLVQVANAIHFPSVSGAFGEDGQPLHPSANDNLKKMLDEINRLHNLYTAK